MDRWAHVLVELDVVERVAVSARAVEALAWHPRLFVKCVHNVLRGSHDPHPASAATPLTWTPHGCLLQGDLTLLCPPPHRHAH